MLKQYQKDCIDLLKNDIALMEEQLEQKKEELNVLIDDYFRREEK